jgi:predicted phosphoribosyltransferase
MLENLHERTEYRNRNGLFDDRFHAGRVLADMLRPTFQGLAGGVVLAIPSGGVPVGAALGDELGLELELAIVRKAQIPGNTEAGFGAVSLEGSVFLNLELLDRLGLSDSQVQAQIDVVKEELLQRNRDFRKGRPAPDLAGRHVVLTDDGLASGYTMLAALDGVARQEPESITVAVPTAPLRSIRMVAPRVDAVYCANVQEVGPFAVAAAYRKWRDLERDEVLEILRVRDLA